MIVESTASKVFLPNVYARDEDTANLYKRMGLNNRQIEILATAVPKQQYYYVSEKGRRLFELALGPLALSLSGLRTRSHWLLSARLRTSMARAGLTNG